MTSTQQFRRAFDIARYRFYGAKALPDERLQPQPPNNNTAGAYAMSGGALSPQQWTERQSILDGFEELCLAMGVEINAISSVM